MKICNKLNESMFSFTFLCKFSCICNFAIFVRIFIKFSPKCRTKKLGSFCSFFNWEGANVLPQIRPRKISALDGCTVEQESSLGLSLLLLSADHLCKTFLSSLI